MSDKPATPLPWKVSGLGYLSNDNAVIAATESVPNLGAGYRHVAITGLDAAYIVHACNNYPRLVEALRDVVSAEDGWGPQEALLRELGEL